MNEHVTVRILSPQETQAQVDALSGVLIDCVEGGASVSFMAPLTCERADAFWQGVAEGVAAGERILLVAQDRTGGEIDGTEQLVLRQPENQPPRAEVSKKLVHRKTRRNGVGAAGPGAPRRTSGHRTTHD